MSASYNLMCLTRCSADCTLLALFHKTDTTRQVIEVWLRKSRSI